MGRYARASLLICAAAGSAALGSGLVEAAAGPDASVAALRRKVVDFAGGPNALARVKSLAFTFIVRAKGHPDLVFHHAYDREKGLYRYECSCADFAKVPVWDETAGDRWEPAPNPPKCSRLVAVYHFPRLEGTVYLDGKPLPEPDNARILRRVHSRVMNERAWMLLPLFMGSRTLKARSVPAAAGPEGERLQGFEGYWGAKPGESDEWTVYAAPDGRVVRTDFRLKQNLEKSTTVYWRGWRRYGPVRIASERHMPESGRRLIFRDIEVNEPVAVSPPG